MTGVGALHGFWGFGIWLYAWSTFVGPLLQQFKWTSAQIGVAYSIRMLANMVENPIAGWIVDRWGPRVLALIFTALPGVGFILLSFIPNPEIGLLWVYVCYGGFIAAGLNMGLYNASWAAANQWFVRRRAMAMGIIAVGTGLGGSALVPATQAMINALGWQTAAIIIGVGTFVVCSPTALLFRRYPPEHYGMRPDNDPEGGAAPTPGTAAPPRAVQAPVADFTLAEAMRTFAFWALSLGFFTSVFANSAFVVFQNVRMQELGYSAQAAANFFGFQFITNTGGRLLVSALGDRFPLRWQMTLCSLAMTVGVLAFTYSPPQSDLWIWAWAIFWGAGFGYLVPALGAVRGAYFGRAAYGKIYGITTSIQSIGGALAPVVAGLARDASGDYILSFLIVAIACGLGIIIYAVTPPPRKKGVTALAS